MAIVPGTRLGAYEILALVGEGGMGQVYRARDTELGRDVAIKVLPDLFAADEARTGRLKIEARALAALNHPRIATLFGMHADADRQFLVMEFVDGETLADRLRRGAMPLADVLRVGIEIADALEAAHEKGIVHRDLKPANVKIAADERVKVLDFGLARLGAADPASSGLPGKNVTHSPTLSIMATQAGVILGTAAYMSPEQAKGLPADQRSDVFSFGVVLYEMLTGRQPFHGDTAAEVLASVMIREAPIESLPPTLHPRLRDLLRRCLQKNPKQRYQHIGDVRAELEHIASDPHAATPAVPGAIPQPLWKRVLPIGVTAIVAVALTAAGERLLRPAAAPGVVTRFSYMLPAGQQLPPAPGRLILAISPDGSQFVYAAMGRINLKAMSEFDPRVISGAELGTVNQPGIPAFSPDGKWLAFYSVTDRALKKIATTGGAAFTITSLPTAPVGISWTGDELLFGSNGGVMAVSANGGQPAIVIAAKSGEVVHYPQHLPGTDAILFTVTAPGNATWDQARIVAESPKGGQRTVLVNGGTDGRYSPTGHLLYTAGGVMFAMPFDVRKLTVSGGAVPVIEGVRRAASATGGGAAQFAVSATGTAVYLPGPIVGGSNVGSRTLILADRSGTAETLKIPSANVVQPRISPDGKRIVYGVDDEKDRSIWVYELSGGTAPSRLTFGGKDRFPIWTPDGKRVAFQSDREGDFGIFWQSVDGGTPERLTRAEPATAHIPESWSPDGQTLLLSVTKEPSTTLGIFSRTDNSLKPFPNIQSQVPISAMFSPDGHWVAYATSNPSSAQDTVYVQPYPPDGRKFQISRSGEDGHHPLWSPDGKELTFIPAPGQLTSVSVTFTPSFAVGNPVDVPRRFSLDNAPGNSRSHDITPDGKRFLGLAPVSTLPESGGASVSPSEIRVIVNWFDELKARVPR
jgi:serine/threonine-protein kinase